MSRSRPPQLEEVLQRVRAIDPLGDEPPITAADLANAQERVRLAVSELPADVMGATVGATPVTPTGSRTRRTGGWAPVLAAVVIAVVTTLVIVTTRSGSGSGGSRNVGVGAAQITTIPPAYRAVAVAAAPLAAPMSVDCAGILVPVPMLAAPGTAQNGRSASSDALRAFLRNNPWAVEAPLTGVNWLLLSQTDDKLVFGQRVGAIGVGSVVVLTRSGSSFTPDELIGCGPVVPAATESGEVIYSARVTGTTLVLTWMTGSNCGSGPARTERVTDRVLVDETSTAVHLLVVSKPAPDAGPSRGSCVGVGILATATVHLRRPLGPRTLHDDARLPVAVVQPER